jgi:N-acetylglucosamine-6-phosphate deacetylase
LGEVAVEMLANGKVVLRGGERLAGSSLRMDQAIANVIAHAGVSLEDALTMATTNAARVGRVTDAAGDAVRFQFSEGRITVLETTFSGQSVYRR